METTPEPTDRGTAEEDAVCANSGILLSPEKGGEPSLCYDTDELPCLSAQ